ncbi:conserved protein of unknown function [Limnospira indica PCC 8005]|uniref:Uncharacterized protein n=1 Tax=Limnospira indica PCC 8005 TaxID=376219 RepID=A0A9P1KK29_9CYAN|nr:conserved protein of unknown function [Limnospira indica PCC 8005]
MAEDGVGKKIVGLLFLFIGSFRKTSLTDPYQASSCGLSVT